MYFGVYQISSAALRLWNTVSHRSMYRRRASIARFGRTLPPNVGPKQTLTWAICNLNLNKPLEWWRLVGVVHSLGVQAIWEIQLREKRTRLTAVAGQV